MPEKDLLAQIHNYSFVDVVGCVIMGQECDIVTILKFGCAS